MGSLTNDNKNAHVLAASFHQKSRQSNLNATQPVDGPNPRPTNCSWPAPLHLKQRLDKFWSHQAAEYDFTADLTGTGDQSELVTMW